MSIQALDFAFNLEVKSASAKLILLCICNYCNDEGLAYPSSTTLTRLSCLDRKTVFRAIGELVTAGIIFDTGKRVGRTNQVIVYRIPVLANSPKNGTVPFFPSNSTVFPRKQSQKRNTEPSFNQKKEPNEKTRLTVAEELEERRKKSPKPISQESK